MSIVAMLVAVLVQVPPVAASLRLLVLPRHIAVVPIIADGNGLIVTLVVV